MGERSQVRLPRPSFLGKKQHVLFRPERSFSLASSKKGTRPVPAPAASVWDQQLPGLLRGFRECQGEERVLEAVPESSSSRSSWERGGGRAPLLLSRPKACFSEQWPLSASHQWVETHLGGRTPRKVTCRHPVLESPFAPRPRRRARSTPQDAFPALFTYS